MKDGFGKNFILYALRKIIYGQTSKSPSNMEQYDVYFKKYIQTCMKETVRLYTSKKEFRLAKGM